MGKPGPVGGQGNPGKAGPQGLPGIPGPVVSSVPPFVDGCLQTQIKLYTVKRQSSLW